MTGWVHPGVILIIGSLLIPFLKGDLKKPYLLLLPAIAFLSVLNMHEGTYGVYHFLGQEIIFGRVDRLSRVFSYIFSLQCFIGMCYGLKVKESGHHIASLVYAGSALGVVFAGDFLTLIIFWEFMAFSSVFLVLYRRTEKAYNAAYRYILVHIFGGLCLMGGIFLQYTQTKSLAFNHMELDGLAAALILIGFILNAAVPPLNAWLPDAYPEATVVGAVFMSAFTTKSAVYVLARGFAGTEILIWAGAIMTIFGVVYATMENDIRRLLSYHIISQVGYMVAAVGIGTELAINGAVAHAFAHIIYKGLLFMGAGSVLHMTGKSKLNELGGLYKTMPYTFILYMIGGVSISAVPFFSGFVSKSMVLSAAAEEHLIYPWLLMTIASAGTFLSTTLKLPYLAFMGEDKKIDAHDPPLNMLIGMGIAAFLCLFIGVYPKFLYDLLPYPTDYRPYTQEHLVWAAQILLFTWLGYSIFIKKLIGKSKITLDTDWFYRKGGLVFLSIANYVIAPVDTMASEVYRKVILRFAVWVSLLCFRFDTGVVDLIVDGIARLGARIGPRFASRNSRFDRNIIDGIVNGVANFTLSLSSEMRRFQTGLVRDYAFAILIGLIVMLNIFFFLF